MNIDVTFSNQDMSLDVGLDAQNKELEMSVEESMTLVGPPGKDGLSAYEVAVENGFIGTETEWLASLKGERGIPGERGLPGVDGKDGYIPVRGKDYFTEEDKAEMVAEVLESDEITQMRQDLEEILADLNYEAITITEFIVPGAGTYEIGTAVPAPTVTWKLNKSPASQALNGEALGVEVRSKVYTGTVNTSKTYTLVATGQKGEKATQSKSINILRGVYYGVLEDGVTINSSAILGLTRELRSDRKKTFTANAGATQRLAYALPSSGYGTPIFYVGGFEGGFYKAATVSFTNRSGYTENYDVWLSDELGNGETTVTVS